MGGAESSRPLTCACMQPSWKQLCLLTCSATHAVLSMQDMACTRLLLACQAMLCCLWSPMSCNTMCKALPPHYLLD